MRMSVAERIDRKLGGILARWLAATVGLSAALPHDLTAGRSTRTALRLFLQEGGDDLLRPRPGAPPAPGAPLHWRAARRVFQEVRRNSSAKCRSIPIFMRGGCPIARGAARRAATGSKPSSSCTACGILALTGFTRFEAVTPDINGE